MKVANPTINEALAAFLAEQQKALSARTFRDYEGAVSLLRHSLDGYAYQWLDEAEQALWQQRWNADEEAGSFCNNFGPEKIIPNLDEFLGYFMVRKVIAGQELLRAAGTVTKKLAAWLEEKGYAGAAETRRAKALGRSAARDLPRAEALRRILYELTEVPPEGRLLEEFEDDYAEIARVEPGRLWFQGTDGESIGPVAVPRRATELATVGWSVSALALGRTRRGWRILEVGNVYPR